MPVARFQMPDGRVARFEVPDGTTPEQAQEMIAGTLNAQQDQPQPQREPGFVSRTLSKRARQLANLPETMLDTAAGLGAGVGQVGLGAQKYLGKYAKAIGADTVGDWLVNDAVQGREKLTRELAPHKARSPIAAPVGEVAGNIAATLPVGAGLGAVAGRAGLPALQTALKTAGFRTGLPAATTVAGKAGQMALRSVAGAGVGGVSAGLVNDDSAGMGALIGGALPPAMLAVGKVGNVIRRTISGPAIPDGVRKSVESARSAGYVIPPTQAKPTMANRLIEGLSGKISTAQNASARNQQITNTLAKKSIGATSLDDVGLQQVRKNANAAYDQLGKVGQFKADAKFADALDKAGASSVQFKADFPDLANNTVDDLITGMKSRGEFDSQSAIEAIKRLRADARANRLAIDNAAKQELGRTQSKVAEALEDLVDRNLQQMGNQKLLGSYREARQTLAKVYDVEKALNVTSGNVDATKLAKLLQKKRPLTGELKTIAEFGNQFPKAAQTVEKMGSLPQASPLDWAAMGTLSAVTQNPAIMAGLLLRPAARGAALSGPVQRGLTKAPTHQLQGLLANPELQQLLYRSAPVISAR